MTQIKKNIHTGYNHILDFLFPVSCLNCKTHGTYLCSTCLNHIPSVSHVIFSTATIPRLTTSRFCGIIPAARYKSTPYLKEAIYLLKYKRIKSLAHPLGNLLKRRINIFLTHNPDIWTIIPTPLHKRKEYSRGFNQNDLLARACFSSIAYPITILSGKHNPLVRIKDTQSQTKLNRTQRIENVKNVFKVINPTAVIGKNILLVDDIVTTGATIKEAAVALITAGAKQVWGCVVAED